MKNIKSLLYAAAAVLLLPLTSCSDDDYPLEPVPAGQEVYFSESLATNYTLARGTSSVEIPVMRIKTDEAETIQIMSEDESGLFTIPASVTFAAGADKTNLTISYDFAALEPSNSYPISLLIMGNQSEWGQSQVKVTLAVPAPWNKLGTGLFRDDMLTIYGVPSLEQEIEIYEYEGRPGYYKINSPYNAVFISPLFDAEPADLKNNVQEVEFIIDATDPNAVVIASQSNPQPMGCVLSPDDGWMSVCSIETGTLVDGVITFPPRGLVVFLNDGGYYANQNGMFRVVLPGVVLMDTTMSAVYDGMKVSADGTEAVALFNLSFGADVASYKYVVAEGDATAEFDTLVAAIADGSAENINEGDVNETSLAITLEGSGMHSFVAVPYNAAGEAETDDAILVAFFFPGQGGAEVPDIEISLELGFASDYLTEAAAAQYPATSCLLYLIEGADVKAATYYLNKTSIIEDSGLAYTDILASYGNKNDNIPAKIQSQGYYLGVFNGLSAGTSYTILVEIESVYGKKYILSAEKTTAAIPYTGELVLGDYFMTHTVNADFISENLFTLENTEDPNKFIVTDFGIEAGLKWHAVYDSSASTLSLDGTIVGNEYRGCMYGYMLGYANQDKTVGWGIMSYEDESSDAIDDPAVFKVDPATKQIVELTTYLDVFAANVSNNQIVGHLNYFVPGTKVELQPATSSVRAKALAFASKICTANIGVQRALKSSKFIDNSAKCTTVTEKREVRTLNVKAEACARQQKSLGDLKLRAERF